MHTGSSTVKEPPRPVSSPACVPPILCPPACVPPLPQPVSPTPSACVPPPACVPTPTLSACVLPLPLHCWPHLCPDPHPGGSGAFPARGAIAPQPGRPCFSPDLDLTPATVVPGSRATGPSQAPAEAFPSLMRPQGLGLSLMNTQLLLVLSTTLINLKKRALSGRRGRAFLKGWQVWQKGGAGDP